MCVFLKIKHTGCVQGKINISAQGNNSSTASAGRNFSLQMLSSLNSSQYCYCESFFKPLFLTPRKKTTTVNWDKAMSDYPSFHLYTK